MGCVHIGAPTCTCVLMHIRVLGCAYLWWCVPVCWRSQGWHVSSQEKLPGSSWNKEHSLCHPGGLRGYRELLPPLLGTTWLWLPPAAAQTGGAVGTCWGVSLACLGAGLSASSVSGVRWVVSGAQKGVPLSLVRRRGAPGVIAIPHAGFCHSCFRHNLRMRGLGEEGWPQPSSP